MRKISEEIMADIEKKETVDFQLNFDDTLYEPKVMPTRVPTLLINEHRYCSRYGNQYATHNLTEVINGT
jgi:DNA gyrase subunit A